MRSALTAAISPFLAEGYGSLNLVILKRVVHSNGGLLQLVVSVEGRRGTTSSAID